MNSAGWAIWGGQCIGCGEDLTDARPADPDELDLCVHCAQQTPLERAS